MGNDNDDNLRKNIVHLVATGDLDQEAGLEMLAVADGAPLTREVSGENKGDRIQTHRIYSALDSTGTPLIGGGLYHLRGEKVRVLREQHGAGNILDRYVRVFYIGAELKEKFECTDARYPEGIFGPAKYLTSFEPIAKGSAPAK